MFFSAAKCTLERPTSGDDTDDTDDSRQPTADGRRARRALDVRPGQGHPSPRVCLSAGGALSGLLAAGCWFVPSASGLEGRWMAQGMTNACSRAHVPARTGHTGLGATRSFGQNHNYAIAISHNQVRLRVRSPRPVSTSRAWSAPQPDSMHLRDQAKGCWIACGLGKLCWRS